MIEASFLFENFEENVFSVQVQKYKFISLIRLIAVPHDFTRVSIKQKKNKIKSRFFMTACVNSCLYYSVVAREWALKTKLIIQQLI